MTSPIAIVGMACEYPDASSPAELWANALAARRSFRRMPAVRMNPDDYLAPDPATPGVSAPDSTYVLEAAVIDGYVFDRVAFRVAGGTYRSADLAHWLALDVASRALADAGYADGAGLPRETTGVLLGNTLTGEFSRANLMRLRWPYVRRVLQAELGGLGWPADELEAVLAGIEARYKEPFPAVGEETLAGGLSNTIAGRICNYFDLKGGGHTVDGACASSLLAVATACSALAAGDIDVAIAGGVDLSLDPFELIGFAKTGALAPQMMRVYDARSAGFWPGEGCGFVVLMRQEDAIADARRVYATIRGWGTSSDGSGGITRPEVEGQILALRRAYRRAGFGIETVGYFEGHGTGTQVGDATELETISRARREADPSAPAAAIGSVKAIIGHTKAAAGIAGLIKATMALSERVLPPTVGCQTPHPLIAGRDAALRPVPTPTPWPDTVAPRASVSAMGFGGINAHVVLEGGDGVRPNFGARERMFARSPQDAELFLFGARGSAELLAALEALQEPARALSLAELGDLANTLSNRLVDSSVFMPPVRAAIVASTAAELSDRIAELAGWIRNGAERRIDSGISLAGMAAARIVFLFPGQGSPANLDGGMMRRRFDSVGALYDRAALPVGDGVATEIAQPAIVTASTAALGLLERFGVQAVSALGHSLGELTALHWGGAYDAEALLRVARARGLAMARLGSPTGAMASIGAPHDEVLALLGPDVVIAGLNSPRQTVVSGSADGVAEVAARARARSFNVTMLPVSHAFHSPLVAAAAGPLAEALAAESFSQLQREVVSTVTGSALGPDADVSEILLRQITAPVRFTDAAARALAGADLAIEVGPGSVLCGLVGATIDMPAIAIDAGGASLRGLLGALGAAFALGAPVMHRELFADRFLRPFDPMRARQFFENPCEMAPSGGAPISYESAVAGASGRRNGSDQGAHSNARVNGAGTNGHGSSFVRNGGARNGAAQNGAAHNGAARDGGPHNGNAQDFGAHETDAERSAEPVLDVVRRLVAERAELPAAAVRDDSRLLVDLHLNSITISQIVVAAARSIGLPPLASPAEFANASVLEVAEALEAMRSTAGETPASVEGPPAGVGSWVRPFAARLEPAGSAPEIVPGEGRWKVVASEGSAVARGLRDALQKVPGEGVVVLVGRGEAGKELGAATMLIDSLRELNAGGGRYVLAGQGLGAAAFARTLSLEKPSVAVTVVDIAFDDDDADDDAIGRIAAEASAGDGGFREIVYRGGERFTPVFEVAEYGLGDAPALDGDDVLLVTGGGKGIAAECALELARESGAALLLMGRSSPAADAELAANLARLDAAGVRYHYAAADVGDAAAVASAIRAGESALGAPVTAFLHGAGTNVPQLIDGLDADAFRRTLRPKVDGARNVLAAIDPSRLKLLVAFGSIIGRAGLRGEGDYALANAWLTDIVHDWSEAHPDCRGLSLEWSIWSGVGMGERLGRIETLLREGIHPITPEAGVAALKRLLAGSIRGAVVLTSRFGSMPTLRLRRTELPLLRFLESPVVHYPSVELVAESRVALDTDPYLADHVFRGEMILPGVMGLEAFAQAALALGERHDAATDADAATTQGLAGRAFEFTDVRFERPVVVHDEAALRVCALRRDDGAIELAMRCSETAHAVDHFTAVCRVGGAPEIEPVPWSEPGEALPIDVDRIMYREILFQRGRFRRLRGYRMLRAVECIADVERSTAAGPRGESWFGAYLPGALVLGDAGARDTAIHCVQGCIPHMTLLPVAVDRIVVLPYAADAVVHVHARERWRRGNDFLYDIDVRAGDGAIIEQWRGLLLHAVETNRHDGPWGPVLLGPYVERRLGELLPGAGLAVSVSVAGGTRRERSDGALLDAAGVRAARRPDGKPVVDEPGGLHVSASHAGGMAMAASAPAPVGCDIETVAERTPELWRDLLGAERCALAGVLAAELGETLDTAATRIWAAAESLKKAGAAADAPLALKSSEPDGWAMLRSGTTTIGTYVEPAGDAGPLVVSVALDAAHDAHRAEKAPAPNGQRHGDAGKRRGDNNLEAGIEPADRGNGTMRTRRAGARGGEAP